MGKKYAYVGSWTVQAKEAEGGGIGVYEYREETGALRYVDTMYRDFVSGMMCVDQRRGVLYSVDEQIHSPAWGMQGGGGRVAAFSIDPKSGRLKKLGEQPAFGTLTCNLAQDGTGDWLVAVNHSDKQVITKYIQTEDGSYQVKTDYSDVTAVLYPLAENGEILTACDVQAVPTDQSVIPARRACLHAVRFAPDGTHCFITNMKQDEVLLYQLNREEKKLIQRCKLNVPTGFFPRYGTFHPEKNLLYINNEHDPSICTLQYDSINGSLNLLHILNTAPNPKFDPGKKVIQTDFGISRDGRYLYDLYRGANCVMVFAIDAQTGIPHKIQELPLGGPGNPRGFAVSPDGRFMLVADNQNHRITTLSVHKDGMLSLTGLSEDTMRYPGNVSFYCAAGG